MVIVPTSTKRKVCLGSWPVVRTPVLLWWVLISDQSEKSELCSVCSEMANSLQGLALILEKTAHLACVTRARQHEELLVVCPLD